MAVRRAPWALPVILVACSSPAMPQNALRFSDGLVTMDGTTCVLTLRSSDGLTWGPGWVRSDGRRRLIPGLEGQPLFRISFRSPGGGWQEISSQRYTVVATDTNMDGSLCLELRCPERWVPRVRLRLQVPSPDQLAIEASLTARTTGVVMLTLPELVGLYGEAPNLEAFFPRDSGILTTEPVDLASAYGQYVRMQIMGAGPVDGGALFVICRDHDQLLSKSFQLHSRRGDSKPHQLWDEYGASYVALPEDVRGLSMAVRFQPLPVRVGETRAYPPLSIGVAAEGWRGALAAYRAWADTWYRPTIHPAFRKALVQGSFDLFSQATPDAALAETRSLGPWDLLQCMVQERQVNGDYGYRPDFGLEGLRVFTEGLRAQGVAVSHYVEGYCVAAESSVWAAHPEWGRFEGGQPVEVWGHNRAMCLDHAPWREWLADQTARLARDLQLDAVYLDELGFLTSDKQTCDNPDHGHTEPFMAPRGVRELFHQVRSTLDQDSPSTALVTEGPLPAELLPQCDGTEEYFCRQEDWNPGVFYRTPVHFMRFVFPERSFLQLVDGDPSERLWQFRKTVFNGLGWFVPVRDPEIRDERDQLSRVLRENRRVFSSSDNQPLVPTTHPWVYANRFRHHDKTIVTVINTAGYPVAGALVPVEPHPQRRWVDLLALRDARTDDALEVHTLVVELEQRGLAVLAELPEPEGVERNGVWVSWSQPSLDRIDAVRTDAHGYEVDRLAVRPGVASDMDDLTRGGDLHVALVGYDADGELRGLLAVPGPTDLDLALDATASASSEHADARAQNVNDGDNRSQWRAEWDDTPRPPWIALTWDRPQPVSRVLMRAEDGVYASQHYSIETSEDGIAYTEVARVGRTGMAERIRTVTFPQTQARCLRVVFHQGGIWADRTTVQTLSVWSQP